MRLPTKFYAEFHDHRQAFGESEYDVDKLIEGAVSILEKYLGADAGRQLEVELLYKINEGIEARENDPLQGDFFAHSAHVPLGERRRIRRGRMNGDQVFRRKLIIDRNHAVQNKAWGIETEWLNDTAAALRSFPPDTVREEVLNEDGSIKAPTEPVPA